jgi:hypothetical protein
MTHEELREGMIVEVGRPSKCDGLHLCRVVALTAKLVAMAVIVSKPGRDVLLIAFRGLDGKVYDCANAEVELRLIATGARYG